jgi:hypothetical protein
LVIFQLAETLAFVSKTLFKIYWLEKRQLFTVGEHVPAWTGQTKVHRAAYLVSENFVKTRNSPNVCS